MVVQVVPIVPNMAGGGWAALLHGMKYADRVAVQCVHVETEDRVVCRTQKSLSRAGQAMHLKIYTKHTVMGGQSVVLVARQAL